MERVKHPVKRRTAGFVLVALALGGCATFTEDRGFATVEETVRARIGQDVKWPKSEGESSTIDARIAELLSKPLAVDDAIQVALLNNQGLQASFHALGILDADRVQAGRLPNPSFTFARLRRGEELEIDRGVHFNIARLITMPLAAELESRRFGQAQREAAIDALRLAAQTRRAYFIALSAQESVRYMEQVKLAADAGADLAQRMAQSGNWSKLAQAREQGFFADAALNLARAEQARTAAREKLTRLMGLWGAQARFTIPERLPDLPAAPQDRPDIEQAAMAQRLDLQSARRGVEALAKNLGLARVTGFVNVFELGVVRNTSNLQPTQLGYEITLELPIFDWGEARVAKAEALYRQALARTAEMAVNARSEVRESYLGYRSSYDIAKHYRDEIVPIRKLIADETQLRYNGMLIGVFELLADARAQVASVNGYMEALRDFWIAEGDLRMAMIGQPMMDSAPRAAAMVVEPGASH